MNSNDLQNIFKIYQEQVSTQLDEAFVDPESGETPSGRSPIENVSYHPKKSVRRKAMGAFAYQMGKEYGGKWKAKTKDPVSEGTKAKPDYFDFDGDGDREESMKKALTDRNKKSVKEALIGRQSEIDANRNGKIDSRDFKILRSSKKKKIKEGFSNWREDLIEVTSKLESKDGKEPKVVEKEVNNTVKINPNLDLGEAIEELGGTLLEMNEIEDFEGVLDDLSESEIFLLSDQLIEEVVEEFFYECIEEGYDILEVENQLLESLEISSSILTEQDSIIESRLEKVKSAVKKVGKNIARGIGYTAGLAVRGAKAVGRELGSGYKRGRHGASGSSSSSSGSSSGSGSSSSSSGSSSGSGSSRPGLLGRIGSKLMRGLARVAKSVSRRSRNFARRLEQGSSSGSGSSSPTTQSSTSQRQRSRVTQGRGVETPSSVHSKSGARTARPRSGIGGGKRVEVAGEPKKQESIKKVSVKDVTPKKSKSQQAPPVGTSENPRIGQPGPDKPKATTRTVSTRRFGSSSSFTPRGEQKYQELKAKIESKKRKSKAQSKSADDQDDTDGKLDDLLKSIKKESYQISEKAESEQQQKLFGLALSVKRGKTPRSEVSAEVLKIVDTMSEKKIRDFAKTSHEGLPKKVQTKEEAIREQLLYRMITKIEEQGIEQAKSPDSSTTSQVFQAQQKAASAKKDLATKLRMAATKGVDVSSVSL